MRIMGCSSKDLQPLIIAVSGFVDEEVQKKCKEAGFNMLFEQPLSVDEIQDKVTLYLVNREQRINQLSQMAQIYDN